MASCSFVSACLAGLSSLVLVVLVVWLMLHEYGAECCGWRTFGLHAVAMTVAFGMFGPLASLTFLLEPLSRPTRKYLHILGHLGAVLLALVGLVTEWILHAEYGGHHLHSSHSWIGLFTVLLYCLQWLAGGSIYTLWAPVALRKRFLPTHVFSGLCLVAAGVVSIITGLLSHLRRKAHSGELRFDLWNWASAAAVVLLIATFGSLYARIPRAELE